MSDDALDRLRLIRTEGVGPMTYRQLLARFGNAGAALAALPELARAGGRRTPLVPFARNAAAREWDALSRRGGKFCFLGDPDYPEFLAELATAPPAIAVLGDVALLSERPVAVVGARNASVNGLRMAERLAADLAKHEVTVVSGLARGVDGAAHRGAMRTGRTVAVLPGGIDIAYPPEHAKLQDEIAATGAVVAEAALGTQPINRHFPRRNRVIAGLSLGVVVIEAAMRSGTLITARLANDAGRELFAVPGSPLDPRCLGSNDLLRQGANLTENVADVLANLPDHPRRRGLARDPMFRHDHSGLAEPEQGFVAGEPAAAELARARSMVPVALSADGAVVDDIARYCQLSIAAVWAVILELELAGRLETLPGNRVALRVDP